MLAQHVLHGKTKGYQHHPQLQRFRACEFPKEAIATYLAYVHMEAERRGYNFNRDKIFVKPQPITLTVTEGQISFELQHLHEKLRHRTPQQLLTIEKLPVRRPRFLCCCWANRKRPVTALNTELDIPRQQLIDTLGGMIGDAGDESAEIRLGVDGR